MQNSVMSILPRSEDTIQTLHDKLIDYRRQSEMGSLSTNIFPCTNVQKNQTYGVHGFMTEVHGNDNLYALDNATADLFGGVSIVEVHVSEPRINYIRSNMQLVQQLLKSYCNSREQTHVHSRCSLEQMMPRREGDFYWLHQQCEFKGTLQKRESIITDYKNKSIHFYDAYHVVQGSENMRLAGVDPHLTDGCVWEPVLCGSIGLYEKRGTSDNVFFLACITSFPHIASEIVQATKADLLCCVSAADFADSKEMWLLENLAKRNRLRLIAEVADLLDMEVPKIVDIYAHPDDVRRFLPSGGYEMPYEYTTTKINRVFDETTRKFHEHTYVQYFNGCTNIAVHQGPIPVHLGLSQGFCIFEPVLAQQAFSGTVKYAPALVNDNSTKREFIFPVCNIIENSRDSYNSLLLEEHSQYKFSSEELLLLLNDTDAAAGAYMRNMLQADDTQGCKLFHGIAYNSDLPMLIYPKIALNMVGYAMPIVDDNDSSKNTDNCNISIVHKKYTSREHCISSGVSVHDIERVVQFVSCAAPNDNNRLCLEWNSNITSILCCMHNINEKLVRTSYITPLIVSTVE